MTKKLISAALAALLIALCFSGCTVKGDNEGSDKLNIVCTVFPQYDWTKQLLGDKLQDANLTLLLDTGTDLHSYQPTAADLITISDCDLFIYVGGNSDKWVDDALKNASNPDRKVVNLMQVLAAAVKAEEVIEGMEAEEEEEGVEYDEHVWLSLKNAKTSVAAIRDALCAVDAANADTYKANCTVYSQELAVLDADFASAVSTAKRKTVLFGDRFPFRYLVDDYGIEYYAAFVGCSAESEASFETVSFLAKKLDELKIPSVIVTETSDKSLASTIISNTADKNQTVITMYAMQKVTSEGVKNGASYLNYMKENLTALTTALN